jgi:hypothetical protein
MSPNDAQPHAARWTAGPRCLAQLIDVKRDGRHIQRKVGCLPAQSYHAVLAVQSRARNARPAGGAGRLTLWTTRLRRASAGAGNPAQVESCRAYR